jgi:hypothetical protein
MIHHTGSNHVQVDVNHTTMQMFVGLNSGGVVPILPERALLPFALVVRLRPYGRR